MAIIDCPTMTWEQFLNIPTGEEVFNHGASECVALANQYNEGVMGGGFVAVGSALAWWTNENVANVHGFTRINDTPQVGDIFIGSGGLYNLPFGHIGVVTRAWDGSTFGTIEQNAGIANAVSRHDRTMQNIDGFLRPVNQSHLTVTLAPNQRQASAYGVFRREAPSTQSARLEGDLEPYEVGNFVGWVHGENVNGNDVWFQGVSGNWFWSGAFTNTGTDGIADLNASTEPTPTPTPEPIPTPEPELSPEPTPAPEIPTEPTTEPETPEEPTVPDKNDQLQLQADLVGTIKPIDLGSIIADNKVRKIVWAVYGILGLFLVAGIGGLQAINALAPEWFMFALGSYAALGPAFSSLAVANIKTSGE